VTIRPQTLLRLLASHSWIVYLAMLLLVGGTWGFISLADEVREGDTQKFDDWAIRALRKPDDPAIPIGPGWLREVGRDVTALGGVTVLMLFTLIVAGYMLMIHKYGAMWLIIAASLGGLIVSTLLKNLFARPRPQLVPHLSSVYTSSFPSGHSMLSACVYLTLGALLSRLVPRWRVKIFCIGVALFLTFIVGLSRVYMGVHYPTDVLAGWAAGLVWAIVCWLAARWLQRRGTVETDDRDDDEDGFNNQIRI
jgi:undecaprenyl-diphosphatase